MQLQESPPHSGSVSEQSSLLEHLHKVVVVVVVVVPGVVPGVVNGGSQQHSPLPQSTKKVRPSVTGQLMVQGTRVVVVVSGVVVVV